MKSIKVFGALALLISSISSPTLYAADFMGGPTIRYFQLTQADESDGLIGIGYSVKLNEFQFSFELGAPAGDVLLTDSGSASELILFSNLIFGWQKSLTQKFAVRAELALGRYAVTERTFSNFTLTTETKTLFALEPRINAVFNITEKVDFSLYAGYAAFADVDAEPTAGAVLRLHFF